MNERLKAIQNCPPCNRFSRFEAPGFGSSGRYQGACDISSRRGQDKVFTHRGKCWLQVYQYMDLFFGDPGKGPTWHTHPKEIGEEDLFYIHKGKGVMVYLQGGKEHRIEFREGEAIHSHHLT